MVFSSCLFFFIKNIVLRAAYRNALLLSVLHRVKKLQNCCGSTRRNLYRKKKNVEAMANS